MLFVLALALTALVCAALYAAARMVTSVWALIPVAVAGMAVCLEPCSLIANDLLVSSAALCLGIFIGQWIRFRSLLAVALATAAVVDAASFISGPTRYLIGGKTRALAYLAICMRVDRHVYAAAGVGDLILLTACSIAMRNCRYAEWAAYALPLSAILGALALGLSMGPLPFLPFLAAAVLLYQYLAKDAPRRASTTG